MSDLWWQRGVLYQVYPRSFQDSTGDGVGDLNGIRQRLDHLEWLGVDAVWLSPIFRSPMADFGYDVADYRDVDPLFGSLADLDELIDDMHRRGMHLLLDFVPNHTSSEHPWFLDARSSRDAEHRDWYIWRDPLPGGEPPNAWQSAFLGSAWEWDEGTGQYYFHSFLKEQPDLDWTNPAVREAMKEVLRFWFRRGIDGFRVDVVNLLAKGPELASADHPDEHDKWGDEPAVHPLMRELRAVADEFDERVLLGEIWLPPTELVTFYGEELDELHMPFNFGLLELKEWRAETVCDAVVAYDKAMPAKAWPNWVLGNHDRHRVATRLGGEQARVATMLLLTLRGTPTLYYGDEIGMTEVDLPRSMWRDPQGLRGGPTRDGCRTPMVWDSSSLGGFTTGTPWLPIEQPAGIDVHSQRDDPASMLTLTRTLLSLRRAEPALNVGEWHDLGHAGSAIAYLRTSVGPDGRRFLVCLNLADKPSPLPEKATSLRGSVVVSTLPDGAGENFEGRDLAANEGLVIRLD
ncbi:MAG: alpha-glucosidase [Chloroflexota bacterium]|jgi:alpha-glucosidase|nr:alpha-glucosidase [Chloroflexota bacterium]